MGKAVTVGTVRLTSFKDSSNVKYSNINNSGEFSFPLIESGEYLLNVSCIGYDEYKKSIIVAQDTTLTIILKNNPISLKEVTIHAIKDIFTNHNGNIKVNIENTILANNLDAINLISKLPMVQVSPNGDKISVVGRGTPLIYLGNQRISINDLLSLSTKDISSIEIINNPSAKYEANGQSVILITRSKTKVEGLKIDLSENISWKRFFQNRNRLNVSFKKNKFEFRGNIQYDRLNLWESNGNTFDIPSKDIVYNDKLLSIGTRKQAVIGGGVYYQLNESDYLSVNASKRLQDNTFDINTNSTSQQSFTFNSVITNNQNEGSRPYFNSNINYNKNLKKINAQLFIGAQYSKSTNALQSNIYNNFNNTQSLLTQNRYQNYDVNAWAGRVDFQKTFGKNTLWESGISMTSAKSKSLFDVKTYDPVANIEFRL